MAVTTIDGTSTEGTNRQKSENSGPIWGSVAVRAMYLYLLRVPIIMPNERAKLKSETPNYTSTCPGWLGWDLAKLIDRACRISFVHPGARVASTEIATKVSKSSLIIPVFA